jgi:nucleoside-diphosphate-sugar epimerase
MVFMKRILVTGSTGQIGSELTIALRKKYGNKNVVALYHKKQLSKELTEGPFEFADVTNKQALQHIIKKHKIKTIYHLASILSAIGEKKPNLAWEVNITSLKNILDLAVEHSIEQVFWPSSIAVFGETTPSKNVPEHTIKEPTTIYGITKLTGEVLCNYYFRKYGLDVRSLRFPGVISYKTLPGGGTTDYAVAMFYEALKNNKYECFVKKGTILPMIYIEDAIKAILDLMSVKGSRLKIRTSYNLSGTSFSAEDLAKNIKKHLPGFKCTYKHDERQKIANSWPKSIDDSIARKEWGWKPEYNLKKIVKTMIQGIKKTQEDKI